MEEMDMNPNSEAELWNASSATPIQAQLTALVASAFKNQASQLAIFYAEKLASLPNAPAEDSLLLARAYYSSGDSRRALNVMETKDLLSIVDSQAHLPAVLLAAQCFLSAEKFEDCINFFENFFNMNDEDITDVLDERAAEVSVLRGREIHPLAMLLCVVGKAYYMCDNRIKSVRALKYSLYCDVYCTESCVFMCGHGLISKVEMLEIFTSLSFGPDESWLSEFYKFLLGIEADEIAQNEMVDETLETAELPAPPMMLANSSDVKLRTALTAYERHDSEEAYRIVRQVYAEDPYGSLCVCLYVATMVDLGLKTDLFYLAHEMVHAYPKRAVSWYAVGCYYWCVNKYEQAQRYFQKATKIDRRFAQAWVGLGHTQAFQEESDACVSAYRTACRLLPGDNRPLVYMAIELLRTNDVTLAAHVLLSALELSPNDQATLNELGVVHMRQGRLEDAQQCFAKAIQIIERGAYNSHRAALPGARWPEVYSNLGCVCRKMGNLDEALQWYFRCLALDPNSSHTHAHIGFTLHLMGRHESAIESYHRALALRPTDAFITDMLTRAFEDSLRYGTLFEDLNPNRMNTSQQSSRARTSGRRHSLNSSTGSETPSQSQPRSRGARRIPDSLSASPIMNSSSLVITADSPVNSPRASSAAASLPFRGQTYRPTRRFGPGTDT